MKKLCTNCKHAKPIGNSERNAEAIHAGKNPDVARCKVRFPVYFTPYMVARRIVTHKKNAQAERCPCYESKAKINMLTEIRK